MDTILGLNVTSWVLAGAGALTLLLYRWVSRPRDLPPGPFAWPLLGNMLSMPRLPDYCMELTQRFGPVSSIWYGPKLLVVLSSQDVVNEAFVKQSDSFSNRPDYLYLINEESKRSGRGVIWQSGQPWKLMRRLMLQTMRDFGVGKRSLEERIQEEVTVVSSRLEASQGSPQVLKADLQRATTNIICSIVFGRRWDYEDEEFQTLLRCFSIIFAPPGPLHPVSIMPWLRFLTFYSGSANKQSKQLKFLYDFLVKHVKEHEATFDPKDLRDLVDVYLNAQREGMPSDVVSTQNMLRGIMDVFLAGSETSATSLDWCILFMILHPEVQKKCQQEIEKVVGPGRMVNMADRTDLPFLNATIMETQRLGNTAALSLPHFTTQEARVGGFTIPAKTMVFANLRGVHLDPDVWPDPMTFKPERFLDDQGRLLKADKGLMPFSTGPRVCLGESLARMEIFLFFANLLQRFSFSRVEGSHLDTSSVFGITNSPRPYQLVASRR